jgi:hypothetical protein
MKITKSQLKQIIKEELQKVLKEFGAETDRMQCLDKMRAKFPSPKEQSGSEAAVYMKDCMERGPENMQEATDPHDQPAGGDKRTKNELKREKKECKDEGGTWREASESKGPKSKSYDLSRGLQGYCEKKKK